MGWFPAGIHVNASFNAKDNAQVGPALSEYA